MHAIQFKAFGPPSALAYLQLDDPLPDSQSAIVRVRSASVNPSDVKNVSGHFGHTVPPRVPGRDFSGTVVDGPAEWLGADVWGTGGDIGSTRDGSHAELIKLPLAALVRQPKSLSHEQASAIGVNFVVAWLGTVDYAKLAPGETIVVIGAGGSVGGAVVQIAKARGCRVIALDRKPPAADSPAGRLIDGYVSLQDPDLAAIAASTKADVVYDTVGGVVFETALKFVKQRGRVVEISATGSRRVTFDLIDFYHNETQLIGVDSAKLGVAESAPIMANLVEGFDSGQFVAPVIAERFALERAREAYEAVLRGTSGRVVITM